MTKRLILIRHAKSGWDDPTADDHTRTLTDRGMIAAEAIGQWLNSNGYRPDLLLSSDATRTAQTTALILPAFAQRPDLRFVAAFYHASPDTILAQLQKETANCIAVVGHNPGIGMLAHMLLKSRPAHRRFSDYPTCATTVIDFSDGQLEQGSGQCADFIIPRDLTE